MPAPSFRFRRFEIFHDKCAMKVGMDGVTLGAWAVSPEVPNVMERRILDIGTGSGLLALMLAQKYPEALIDAVEKDVPAALQAAQNVAASPWPDTVQVYQGSFPEIVQQLPLKPQGEYHLIVCNPPFFKRDLKPLNQARSLARHSGELDFATLVRGAAPLLHPTGFLSVIIPFQAAEIFEEYCYEYRLFLQRSCRLVSVAGKAPIRMLMSFGRDRLEEVRREELVVTGPRGAYTPEYRRLTEGYYLPEASREP
ncbi:MAG: methyltransferase [Bacteroidales bacterium]|nr:methyltransferase [Bacteroidales bacterium]